MKEYGKVIGEWEVVPDDHGAPRALVVRVKMADGFEWEMKSYFRRDQVELVSRIREESDDGEAVE